MELSCKWPLTWHAKFGAVLALFAFCEKAMQAAFQIELTCCVK